MVSSSRTQHFAYCPSVLNSGEVEEKPEGLVIRGKPVLSGGTVSSWNDHRIAMALASITPKLTGPLTIEGAESVKKSYPRFWEDFRKVGGKIVEA